MAAKFLDLDEIVKNWAWRRYEKSEDKKQRKLRKKHDANEEACVGVSVDWSEVKFHDHTDWTRLADDDFEDAPKVQSQATEATQGAGAAPALSPLPAASSTHGASILFMTKFTNNSKEDQEYTLQINKTTRSSSTTSVESGFSKGFDLGVTLKTPGEVFEMNAGYHREVSLTNAEGETFEEELSWGANSTIKVKGGHVAEASLIVKEKKQSGDFIITTKIQGMVYVTFTNIKDNNTHIKSTGGNIRDIIDQYLEQQRRKKQPVNHVTITEDCVVISTKGTCRFRFGIKQEVVVDQMEIKKS